MWTSLVDWLVALIRKGNECGLRWRGDNRAHICLPKSFIQLPRLLKLCELIFQCTKSISKWPGIFGLSILTRIAPPQPNKCLFFTAILTRRLPEVLISGPFSSGCLLLITSFSSTRSQLHCCGFVTSYCPFKLNNVQLVLQVRNAAIFLGPEQTPEIILNKSEEKKQLKKFLCGHRFHNIMKMSRLFFWNTVL